MDAILDYSLKGISTTYQWPWLIGCIQHDNGLGKAGRWKQIETCGGRPEVEFLEWTALEIAGL